MKGPLADYYHWEETGRGIRIYMHSAMVDRLQAEVLRAAACGPDSGTEAGGILLGRTEEDHGKTIAIVDDFVPVLCSHGGGRLYDVSGDDSVNLEAALLRAALAGCADADAPAILGYYRSHLREGMSLSAADLQVIDSYFQAPASVFLLIKTVAGGNACTAGFFFWEDGQIQSEFSSLEVALGRASDQAVPTGAAEALDEAAGELPAELTALFETPVAPEPPALRSPSETTAPAPAPPVKSGSPWLGLWLRAATIVIAIAALVVAVIAYLRAPRPPRDQAAATRPASVLGLRVERNPPDLLVSWDCNTREVASTAAPRSPFTMATGRSRKP